MEHFLHKTGLDVTALVTVWFSRYSEAEEVGRQGFRHCGRLFNWNGVGLWLLGEVADSDHEVSAPLIAMRKGDRYVDDYLFERRPDVLLMHEARNLGSQAVTSCVGAAVLPQLLDIVPCL